ncbi:hypothetical protein [Streptomyces sp. NPDC096033]|uniref:hypothetical protein n=1 Tax=Streptomyces sp. NPDC096033 TaxID=3366071 RepID=UPI003806163D
MEAQAAPQPVTSHASRDEGIRTCRPAIVPQARSDGAEGEGTPNAPDSNIIRGED